MFYYFLILSIFLADQLTKLIIKKNMIVYQSKEVIKGFFNITYIHNKGAIFGFLAHSQNPYISLFLMLASLGALALIVYYFIKIPSEEKNLKISFSLILGGAVGNLFDRVVQGYVIDFLDFHIRKFHWPAFNLADASITIGALFLIFILLTGKPKCSLCS